MKRARVLAKAVLQDADGNVLLIRRSETDDRRPNFWDFPGGNVEDGEDFVVACMREIQEETGLTVAPGDLHLAFTLTELFNNENVCWLTFIGSVSEHGPAVVLSFEHSEYSWVSLDEAIEMITYNRQKKALLHIKEGNLLG